MEPQNKERFERLCALAPMNAIRAWLDGDFGFGDEPAMIAAIRKDTRVTLSDDDIANVMWDAMEARMDAQACLERLGSAK